MDNGAGVLIMLLVLFGATLFVGYKMGESSTETYFSEHGCQIDVVIKKPKVTK